MEFREWLDSMQIPRTARRSSTRRAWNFAWEKSRQVLIESCAVLICVDLECDTKGEWLEVCDEYESVDDARDARATMEAEHPEESYRIRKVFMFEEIVT